MAIAYCLTAQQFVGTMVSGSDWNGCKNQISVLYLWLYLLRRREEQMLIQQKHMIDVRKQVQNLE